MSFSYLNILHIMSTPQSLIKTVVDFECHLQSVRIRGTYNLLLGLEDAHLAEPDVKGRTLEGSILLLHHDDVDSSGESRSIYLGVELLKCVICVRTNFDITITISYLDVFNNITKETHGLVRILAQEFIFC